MMPVSRPFIRGEACDDDVRSEFSDSPYGICKNIFATPESKGFIPGFRESKIECPGKKLLASIYTSCRKKLLGADQAKFFCLFGADEVLTAIASSQRKVACAVLLFFCQPGYQPSVFVV